MTLQEIQQFSLEILEDVHSFCMENNIRYSLAYGTLIGAIRHNGFIPWDDDIDIVMPRPDYDRFLSIYKSPKFHLAIPGQSYLAFSRVYDVNKTYVKQLDMPWFPSETGIWIDIFPLDSISDNQNEFLEEAKKIDKIWNEQLLKRYTINPLDKPSFSKIVKCFVKKILFRKDIAKILTVHDSLMKMYKYGTTKHLGQLSCPDNIYREYFPSVIADDFIITEYENSQFCIFKEYDTFLRCCYGDYMQLPPETDRVPKQDSKMIFYWK